MLESALRALRSVRRLRGQPLGVMLYTDEGRDARYSAEVIRTAAAKAARVLVLRPGQVADSIVTRRRGQRKYRFRVEGDPRRPGQAGKTKKPEVLRWTWNQLEELCRLSNKSRRVSISALGLDVTSLPMLLPHRTDAIVLLAYPDAATADEIERKMADSIAKSGPRWELKKISDRPAMAERRANAALAKSLENVAGKWEIELKRESSVWPSVAGLVPPKLPCLCGIGPVARDLGTPNESVQRISLVQRTLLLAELLLEQSGGGS
jgi:D-alanine-D-alanine ligase